MRGSFCASYLLIHYSVDYGYCGWIFSDLAVFSLLSPIVFYKTLQADSEYWRGHWGSDQK